MKIVLITPARSSSRSGNTTTSMRWARILRQLGHRVHIADRYSETDGELMIALHAWRSADSIRAFRKLYPDRPLIVGLSGTDIYDYIDRDPAPVFHSLACADRLVALQELPRERVPAQFREKLRIVYQSAVPLRRRRLRRMQSFDVAVIGHLREVKDPFRAAEAARRLPASSRIRIVHLGAAETRQWAVAAKAEMAANPRYVWRGDPARGCPTPARPRAGAGSVISERRRSKRHIRGRRRQRAGARVAHRRLGWAARTQLSRLFSSRRHAGADTAPRSHRARSRIPQ